MLRIDEAEEESLRGWVDFFDVRFTGFNVRYGVIKEEIALWVYCGAVGPAGSDEVRRQALLIGGLGWCFFTGRPTSVERDLGSV